MKILNQKYDIIIQDRGILGVMKQIENAGRTCYKSEDKIEDGSAELFTKRMIDSGHNAMLEHGTIYLYLTSSSPITGYKYKDNKYSKYVEIRTENIIHKYITTNYRVLIENNWISDLKYMCEPTEHHEKRISVKITCDRGVSHEFVRHRVNSYAQESTRYCDYIKDKFQGNVSFIMPLYIKDEDTVEAGADLEFIESLYYKWRNKGYKPQEARFILPNALKTELFMTGFTSDWSHFFSLRDHQAAHPQARELAAPLHKDFLMNLYINK